MKKCSVALGEAINHEWLKRATLVPIPPSKGKDHPEYDDRMTVICEDIPVEFNLDVRELVTQTTSMATAHGAEPGHRPDVDDLLAVYQIDEDLAEPTPEAIAIVDDVLTAGTHYRAMKRILSDRFPNVPINGVFIARRVFPPDNDE